MISNKKLVIVKYVSMKAVESENKECELQVPRMKNIFWDFWELPSWKITPGPLFKKIYNDNLDTLQSLELHWEISLHLVISEIPVVLSFFAGNLLPHTVQLILARGRLHCVGFILLGRGLLSDVAFHNAFTCSLHAVASWLNPENIVIHGRKICGAIRSPPCNTGRLCESICDYLKQSYLSF